VLVYVLRCYRLVVPKLVSGFNFVGTLAGISLVTILGLIKDFTVGDFVIVGVGVLLIVLAFGAYLLYRDTEGDKWILGNYFAQVQQAEAARTDYAALKEALGYFLTWGLDLESVDIADIDEETAGAMEVWVEQFRKFVADAFDMGEHALVLRRVPLDGPPHDQISAAVEYLDEVIHSRLQILAIRDGFNAQVWIESFREAQEGEQDEVEDQP
jgi:hypothetical protein